uniref:E3 ubiquitin-protein ligase RNF26 n=1 Tax=Varanus komodoensis TaxID=61221 RepID=A0A8D2J250_VARKO
MDLVFLVINGIGMILDLLVILLDVNFFLISTLVSLLIWLVAFVYNLPNALIACVFQCWNGVVLFFLCIAEAMYYLTLSSLHTLVSLLRGFCSSMESLKVAGHLFNHLTLRSKEIMHRSFWNLVGSGQSLLRQVCEVCAIIMSLVAYFINSIINICLIGTQNLFSLGLALWETVVGPFLRVTDIFATFVARLSSSAIAMVILLWTPCQLVFDLLASVSKSLINVFFLNLYGLVWLSVILAASVLILNPQLTWTLVNQVSDYLNTMPSYHRLLRDIRRLYQVVLLSLEMILSSQAWRRLADWSLQVASWNTGGPPAHRNDVDAGSAAPRGAPAGQHLPPQGEGDPWLLLKEQEERKKCVICQDQTKTVLLLPCRHLCLCQECTEILLQQAIYQRNCPLCRQMILQTLNVYL